MSRAAPSRSPFGRGRCAACRLFESRTERPSLRLVLCRVRQGTFVLENLAEITAIDPTAADRAADEVIGLVHRTLLADAAAEISASGDHFLDGTLWINFGHSLSITIRISSEMTFSAEALVRICRTLSRDRSQKKSSQVQSRRIAKRE